MQDIQDTKDTPEERNVSEEIQDRPYTSNKTSAASQTASDTAIPEQDTPSLVSPEAADPAIPEKRGLFSRKNGREQDSSPRNIFQEESFYDNHPLPNGQMRASSSPNETANDNGGQPAVSSDFTGNHGAASAAENFLEPQTNASVVPGITGQSLPNAPRGGKVMGILLSLLVLGGVVAAFVASLNPADSGSGQGGYEAHRPYNTVDGERNDSDNISSPESDPATHSEDAKIVLPVNPPPEVEPELRDANGKYTVEGLAQATAPSVVGIITYAEAQNIIPLSEGSGVILSADGYVVTNAHVLENAEQLKVVLSTGEEFIARIVGRDSRTDLAVVQFDPGDTTLVTAELGDSSVLRQGQQVVAIGNPGGFSNSITVGYVSALNRKIRTSSNGIAMDCIQTDAAISPGNSGGALLNMYGQVIGITSSKYSPVNYSGSGTFEGIGFAISINDARPILEDIISAGYITNRPRVGITYIALDAQTARANGVVSGLYVQDIDPESDVANTDLQPGDIITELNGVVVYDATSIQLALENCQAGDEITAKIYRKNILNEISEFEIRFQLMVDTSLS